MPWLYTMDSCSVWSQGKKTTKNNYEVNIFGFWGMLPPDYMDTTGITNTTCNMEATRIMDTT